MDLYWQSNVPSFEYAITQYKAILFASSHLGTVPGIFFLSTQGILILTIILHGRSQGPHFTDKKTDSEK